MRRLLLVAIFGLLGSEVYRSQIALEEIRKTMPPGYEIMYLPSGKYLIAVSLGYRQVLADLIYLWSIQHTTNPRVPDRFERVEHMYRIIADLDPDYIDPYHIGAMTMVYEMGDLPMAFRLLDRGIENLPHNWSIPVDAGFYAYMQARDYDLAIKYFEIAMARNAHVAVRRLHAHMFERKGDLRRSRDFWREIYESAPDERTKRISYNHFFDLSQEVDLDTLRNAIVAYTAKSGHRPANLSRLVEAGILRELPVNPEGDAYLYDSRSGEVKPAKPFRLVKRGE